MFPTLAGQGWSVHKKPAFATLVAGHASGREVRDALYAQPIWSFELAFDGLDGTASGQYGGLNAQSLQSLMGLFLQSQGQFGTFLYVDPTDCTATGQAVGTGDGATTSFSLARALGGFVEPVGWVTTLSNVYVNGVSLLAAGVATPAAPSLQMAAGGSLAATTYYAKTTYVTAGGGETLASSESSLTMLANRFLRVNSPVASVPALATGWNAYVGSTAGGETKQNVTPIALGAYWQETNAGLVVGAAPPTSDTTGWTLTTPNALGFDTPLATGVSIAADFSFAFLCRFDSDDLDFEQFMANLWKADSVKFRSVRSQ